MSRSSTPNDAAFAPVDLPTWRAQVEAELRGADFESLLRARLDGSVVQPVYPEASAAAPLISMRSWSLAPRVCCADVSAAVQELQADVAGGAAASFWMSDVEALSADEFLELAGAGEGLQEVHFDAVADPAALWSRLQEVRPAEAWAGCLGADPVGRRLRTGESTVAENFTPLAVCLREVLDQAPAMRTLGISAEAVSDGGAHAVLELGVLLASTADTWRGLEAAGIAPADAAAQTLWRLTLGRDTFDSLCKLRAARLLFRKLAAACGTEAEPLLHAVCARRTLSRRDPWSNLLRTTTQVFAGLLGGADIITPTAWDEALGRPSAFARRIARNIGPVLAEEGALDSVADPAAGAGMFEARTEELARTSWEWFQAIEARGGIATAIDDGSLNAEIATVAAARRARIEDGSAPVLGASVFTPDQDSILAAEARTVAEAMPWPAGAALPAEEGGAACAGGAIPLRRDSADCESMAEVQS